VSSTIRMPSFNTGAFFYGQLLESLIIFKRENVPEITDESEFEPFVQLLRAFALVGHLNNVLYDELGHENTLPTARLPETVRNMLRLIGYEMSPATPAQASVVYQLSRPLSSATTVVPLLSQAATQQVQTTPSIYYEASEEVTVGRTDRVDYALAQDPDGTFTDHTTSANTIGGSGYRPWSPEAPGSMFYMGHSRVMWDQLTIEVITDDGPTDILSLEYYDGDFQDIRPDDVSSIGGGQLRFDLTSLLGTSNRAGAIVRVQFHDTGTYQEVASEWDGTTNVAHTNFLGQSSASLDTSDYGVGAEWRELAYTTETEGVEMSFLFALPQSESLYWKRATVDGLEAYWVRMRIVAVSGAPQASSLFGRVRIDLGKQYVLSLVTQGKSILGETLGSSTAAPDQRFRAGQTGFILSSQKVYVDGVEWDPVPYLLNSQTQERHYKVELGEDDRPEFIFGNGSNGQIPPLGQGNVVADYRYGAEENGNVGALAITVDKSGLTFVDKLWNPRQATGWSEAMSSSDAGLALAKEAGPAQFRTRGVALGPDDAAEMTIDFVDDDGAKPYSRAIAIEEGFGPKTLELVVVPRGGAPASSDQLRRLETYFNGDKTSIPPKRKRIVTNQRVVATNFRRRVVYVEATVTGSGVASQDIIDALTAILSPEARQDDGVTFRWKFASSISHSFIEHHIHSVDERITQVVLSGWSDIALNGRELPDTSPGSIQITIV
jgi:hypothetical protein